VVQTNCCFLRKQPSRKRARAEMLGLFASMRLVPPQGLLMGVSAPRRYGAMDRRRHHRRPRPLQCPSTSRAFRLTPGRAWSIDTPSLCTLGWRVPRLLHRCCSAIYPVSAKRGGARMRRPHYQPEKRGGSRICAACGKSLTSMRPVCGRQPLPRAAFCNHQGPPNWNGDGCRNSPGGTW